MIKGKGLRGTEPNLSFPAVSATIFGSRKSGNLLHIVLETRIGGVKSPKIRGGGVKILSLGAPETDPFLQRFYRRSPI